MTHSIDDELQQAMQGLKSLHASPGFTDRLLERLDSRKAQRARRRRLGISGAAIGVLALLATLTVNESTTTPTAAELAIEARQLREEHDRLRSDLEDLSARARDAAPVLYLGGDDDLDLVLDLAPIVGQSAPAAATASDTLNPYEL